MQKFYISVSIKNRSKSVLKYLERLNTILYRLNKTGIRCKIMCRFCCCFRPKTEAEEKSRQIDRELDTFRKQQEQIINLLMLGAGECGKSTVVKQMRIIYADGFSDNERLQHLPIIRGNAIKSIAIILKAMNTLDITFRELLLFNPKNSSQFNYMLLRGGFSKVHSVFSRLETTVIKIAKKITICNKFSEILQK